MAIYLKKAIYLNIAKKMVAKSQRLSVSNTEHGETPLRSTRVAISPRRSKTLRAKPSARKQVSDIDIRIALGLPYAVS
jgi:hypothetical protein